MLKSSVIACFLLAALAGCGKVSAPPNTQSAKTVATAEAQAHTLDELVEGYYDRYLQLDPITATAVGDHRYDDRLPNNLSESWLADALALEQESLEQLQRVDREALDERSRLTYDAFKYGRELAIDGFRFPSELLPIDQFSSLPLLFAQMGSGSGIQPFQTVRDYENFLKRMAGFAVWMDQAIANMKLGAQRRVVLPRVLVERVLPQLHSLIVKDAKQSLFYKPLLAFPQGVADPDRARLSTAYVRAIDTQVTPAYAKLHQFLQREYLPKARATAGYAALPNGAAWYAYLTRYHTTTSITAAQAHEIGLQEVTRIRAELARMQMQVNMPGDLQAFIAQLRSDPRFQFKSPQELLDAYQALKERVAAAVPKLFALMPQTDLEIRAVEPFRERSAASASYQPGAPDGSRPGVFYVNTYDLASRPSYLTETIYLHEAVPGHHLQLALQFEAKDLPRFRRFGADTAYVEGWGLYSESLGKELGMYEDPYQYIGFLTAEIWRAVRLVVDTGLHYKGWTREQAIEYMRANTAIGEADVVAEVERYMAAPGQALAYKIGQRKIRELRTLAERQLGPRFDVKEFHTQVLKDGSMPLAVLQAKIERWIKSQH